MMGTALMSSFKNGGIRGSGTSKYIKIVAMAANSAMVTSLRALVLFLVCIKQNLL